MKVRKLPGASLAAVLLCLATPSAYRGGESAQTAPSPGAPASVIAALEGDWFRNEDLSEDAIQKTASLWRNPNRRSAVLTNLSASLADGLGRLRLRVVDGRIHIRNARFETIALPTDGSTITDPYGNRHRASILPGALETETARPDWLLIETFYREAAQLHRVVEIQSRSFPNLRFLTIYEWAGPGSPPAGAGVDDGSRLARPATIRIVPPRRSERELLTGRVEIETLIIDRAIGSVDFLLDGRRVDRVRKLPFRTRVDLGSPPREQTLEVRAHSARGAFMGGDRLVLNRFDPPFGVRIGAIRRIEPDGVPGEADVETVSVETRVAVPRGAVLSRVDFYYNENLAQSVTGLPQYSGTGGFRAVRGTLSAPEVSQNDYVRVTAALADGRELEDAQLVEGVTFKGEIDVQLIHLQVLVVDGAGAPVDGQTAADFRIVEDGEQKAVVDVQQAGDVPLILGMAIDSSASMRPIWNQLRTVVGAFLENSLVGEDRAFLVDFDEGVRLLQRPTGSLRALRTSMDRLTPNGGTALNDGILFSLIMYGTEPGRRALVVVTDGVDIDSRSEPEQAAIFAERVGIPLYLIDLGKDRIALPTGNDPGGSGAAAGLVRTARSADHVLRMQQQARQSGGRLFQIDPELAPTEFLSRVEGVFDQIREDLRRQQVLTYYTGRPVGTVVDPDVQAVPAGLTVKSVLPLDRVEAHAESTGSSDPPTAVEDEDPTDYTYTTAEADRTSRESTGTSQGTPTAVADTTDRNVEPPTPPSSPSPGVVGASRDDAVVVAVSGLPSRMAAGAKLTVTATVTNTGTTTWTPFGGYGLGSQSPQDNDTWGLRRAPLFGNVAPNQTATFEFPVTAPEDPGSYVFSWRMVRDPGEWFGAGTGDLAVTVEDVSFGGATILAQTWDQGEPIAALILPAAVGGDGQLVYGLTPTLPTGVSFDVTTRLLSGTPMTPQPMTTYTYTARDADGDVAVLSFPITVQGAVGDDAAFVSVLGLPSRMAVGGGATVTVTMRNTGSVAWTPFGGYGLGSQSPQDNDTWGLRRAPLSRSVAPNETATFEFPITAPLRAGVYTFSWRMVRDPGGWFGAGTGEVTVSVEEP